MNLPSELDHAGGDTWDALVREHIMCWSEDSSVDFHPSTSLNDARQTIAVLIAQHRRLSDWHQCLERKASHGCYGIFCNICD